jgi:Tol biopolymer transport system component
MGTRLGAYEILAPIGAGGMGEVYRARDAKLNRDVAIKVLPAALSNDIDYMARFQCEAQILASLNHPSIAAIYGLEDHAIVMELVEGPTLADRIAQGPLSIAEALPIAKQIAEAIEAAHEKGIIHRDLKPGNIKIRPEGIVKVLDFGLAKTADASAKADTSNSPTLTIRATEAGLISGTAAYMSPEQAAGKPVNKRADIWSFGVVLWEMLTGDRLFQGETVSHTLADVLRSQIEFDKLPVETPTLIRELLRRCLDRHIQTRLRDIGEARIAIQTYLANPVPQESTAVARHRQWLWVAAAAVFAIIAAAAIWIPRQGIDARTRRVYAQISPPPSSAFRFAAISGGSAISPSGDMIAFAATNANGLTTLWVRPVGSFVARELAGTEDARHPFWSPDSRFIGFFATGKLKRVDLSGGAPVVLSDARSAGASGGAWSKDGTIIFSVAGSGLLRVPASGGTPSPLTRLDSTEVSHRWPQLLPDGHSLLYLSQGSPTHTTGVYLSSLDRPLDKTKLIENPTLARYVPPSGGYSGFLLWVRGNTLMAQPFDPKSATLSGEAEPVPNAEAVGGNAGNGIAYFSTSNDGTILSSDAGDRYQIAWFSRDGTRLTLVRSPDRYGGLRISPDGNRAATSILDLAGDGDIWEMDLARGTQTRLSFGGHGHVAIWSPDGRRLAYNFATRPTMYMRDANGAAPEETILDARLVLGTSDWSPDGRYILYAQISPDTAFDLWLLPLKGNRNPISYLRTRFNEMHGRFSPDGRWIAYTSDESGRQDVYVQSFPASEIKLVVSNAGGAFPAWRRDGRELFYRGLDGRLMVVSVRSTEGGLQFGVPAPLFPIVDSPATVAWPYDVSADGQRILALAPPADGGETKLSLLINWQAAIKK